MKQAAFSFFLVLALEAISAVVEFLKNKLMDHISRNSEGFSHPEFA